MACGSDVDGVVLDFRDGRDAGEQQEESEVIGKITESACDGFACGHFLGFEVSAVSAVSGEDEPGLALGRLKAGFERGERRAYLAGFTHGDVDVVAFQDATR